MSEHTKIETKAKKLLKEDAVPKRGFSKLWIFVALAIAIIGYVANNDELKGNIAYQYLLFTADSKLLGEDFTPRIPSSKLNELQKNRWSDRVIYSFPNATPVPEKNWVNFDGDFVDQLMTDEKPFVFKKTPVQNWPAVTKWTPDYISRVFPIAKVHVPSQPVVRLHQADETHPFGKLGVKWIRQWKEDEVLTKALFEGKKLMYTMINSQRLPHEMQRDVNISPFTVAWSIPMEVNLWMGTPTVTTPAHYDFVHNFYAQVRGKKRFIMFPPEDADSLYLYTDLHPSSRQSQVNFNAENSSLLFPEYPGNLHPMEVVLTPGDVLYIPPFWFHYVCVVGEEVSMSISTHTESHHAKIHERIWSRATQFKGWFFDKYRGTKPLKTLSGKIQVIEAYVYRLFGNNDKVALKELKRIVDHRWSHFEHDHEVIGLTKLIENARYSFPTVEAIVADFKLTKDQLAKINSASDDVRGLLGQIKGGAQDTMLANHIESFSALVLGELNVDPFLRHLISNLEKGKTNS